MRPPAISVKVRLALMCGGLFLLSGAVLLSVNYVLVRAAMPSPTSSPAIATLCMGSPGAPSLSQNGPAVGCDAGTGPVMVTNAVRFYRTGVLKALLVQSGVALAATLVLALLLGWVAAHRTLRPVQAVVATARRLGADNLDQRIRLRGPRDELTELADTFDEMLDRLAAAFDSQRRFVANASHELRTPLAAQRTLVEVAMARPAADRSVQELGARLLTMNIRIESLIEGLLLLARSDRGLADRQPLDLGDIVDTVVESQRAAAATAGVEVQRDRPGGRHVVLGDHVLLERMVSNLLDNAIKYNHRGGTVWLREDGDPVLEVVNTGPAVPSAATAGLFEPFHQLRRGRGGAAHGAGLGLSIVASIARAHGGSVRASSRPGGGLRMAVFLPVGARGVELGEKVVD